MGATNSYRKMIAKEMFNRGKNFTGAALLLNEKIEKNYAYLYLLCLGFEILIKSALLKKDYIKFKPKLKSQLGHDLEKAFKTYVEEFPDYSIDENIYTELPQLNSYNLDNQKLRYASNLDVFILPLSIESESILKFNIHLIQKLNNTFDD